MSISPCSCIYLNRLHSFEQLEAEFQEALRQTDAKVDALTALLTPSGSGFHVDFNAALEALQTTPNLALALARPGSGPSPNPTPP